MTEQNNQPPAEAGEGVVAGCKGTNCGTVSNDHSKECMMEHDAAYLDTPGNRHPDFRYAGYKGHALSEPHTNDQFSAYAEGIKAAATITPLYTSQTTATQAAVAAAMHKCADICNPHEDDDGMDRQVKAQIRAAILASIPTEATAALDAYVQEKCLEVANEMNTIKSIVDDDSIYRIVTSVIEKGK
jgi:hypothetical protein